MIERVSSNQPSLQLSTPPRRETTIEIKEKKQPEPKEEVQEFTLAEKTLQEIVQGLNDFLSPTHTSLKFEFHEKLNEYYVTLVDDKTKEVVREIPPRKLLDFYAAMTERIGLLIDRKI